MKNLLVRFGALLFLFGFSALNGSSMLDLPPLFSDNMVFQQNAEAPIWGTSAPGQKVEVNTSWDGRTIKVKADAKGAWKATLQTPSAGGPYVVTIDDGSKITLRNVLVGEVWICSGQSNMEMPMAGWGKVMNYEQEVRNADHDQIRLFQVKKETSVRPRKAVHPVTKGWAVCAPATVEEFSSVAYFYARELQRKLHVPVGVVDVTWGGTIVEAWTSESSLRSLSDFTDRLNFLKIVSSDTAVLEKSYRAKLRECHQEMISRDLGFRKTEPVWADPALKDSSWGEITLPSRLEETCLPDFNGVVWLRREIELKGDFLSGDLQLSLGPIDDDDICYFNGVEIGRTFGYGLNRLYTVPKRCLREGRNVLSVRVVDTGGDGGIYGEKRLLYLTDGTSFLRLAGPWKYRVGIEKSRMPVIPVSLVSNPNFPTLLFNAMVNPLVPFAMRGVIWYQGESNASRAYQYRRLFPLLIRDWRKQWQKDFPFYYVQLANFKQRSEQPCESDWAELREAQLRTLQVKNTGMAVTIDIGDANDIHPKNKQEVGRRLSLIALANNYGFRIPFSGPLNRGFQIRADSIEIKFDHTEGGLIAKDGELKGFTLAGTDRRFHPAKAVIRGNRVVVSSDRVKVPVAVRYAWESNPECSLYNGSGLPASPFRTDRWPGVTVNAR
jgi:sialate O-acetylesterase